MKRKKSGYRREAIGYRKKTLFFILSLLLLSPIAYCPSPALGQTYYPTNALPVAWDPVTVPSGTVSYKLYTKPATGGTETLHSTVTGTTATITFAQEGRYLLGVQAVRTVPNVAPMESTISWSDNPAVVQGGVTFGAQYYVPPAPPANLRRAE